MYASAHNALSAEATIAPRTCLFKASLGWFGIRASQAWLWRLRPKRQWINFCRMCPSALKAPHAQVTMDVIIDVLRSGHCWAGFRVSEGS